MPPQVVPYRAEAIAALEAGSNDQGDVLRLSPGWIHWSYWMLFGVFIVALAYALIGSVTEYASGPALIRAEGHSDVTAPMSGTVVDVRVRPGQRVRKGALLARLYDGLEAAELQRLRRELELQLVRLLRDPNDQAARQTLTSLRASIEQARTQLAARALRSPRDGIVSDVRIRPGQLLQPGEPACSLIGPDASFSVDVLLPGQYRPMVRAGMSMRVELLGFQYSYQDVIIDSVGDEVVGPGEARRYLGPELGDALQVQGPVVLVHARLANRDFASDDRRFNFFSGIPARADVRVRTESILVTLIPALRSVLRRAHV